jgi:amino acid transporter
MISFTMSIPKDTSIYAKINSFGVIFIMIIIITISGVGIYSMTNTNYTYDKDTYDIYHAQKAVDVKTPYLSYISLFQTPFAPLCGVLGGGFYFHNIALSVCKNARNPENNVRDVFLGYLATFVTYVICGVLGYYGFTGSAF